MIIFRCKTSNCLCGFCLVLCGRFFLDGEPCTQPKLISYLIICVNDLGKNWWVLVGFNFGDFFVTSNILDPLPIVVKKW